MPTRDEILAAVMKRQVPELSSAVIDDSLQTISEVKRGQKVAVYMYTCHPLTGRDYNKPPVTGSVTRVWKARSNCGNYYTHFTVREDCGTEQEFIQGYSRIICIKLVAEKEKFVPPKFDSVDSFVQPYKPKSSKKTMTTRRPAMSIKTNTYDANEESDNHTLDMIAYRVDEILQLSGTFCKEESIGKARQIISRLDNI